MESKLWQIGMDALYLVSCALQGQQPGRDISCDLGELYTFCEFHSITALTAAALEMLWKDSPSQDTEHVQKFRQTMAMSMRKSILLNAEREQILQHLENIGCWHMPLKGSLLQYDYPKLGMRQMSDNDILIDASREEEVHEFLCGRGYEAVSYQTTVENNYHKAPVYNFEMHTALFGMESPEQFRAYYADVRQRLVPVQGKRFGYRFTPEDFYIYMIAHAWKHAQRSGIGIRLLADIHVYLQKHGINREYVDTELAKFGAAEFEYGCRQLSEKLLAAHASAENLSEQERELLEQLFTAGTYGTQERKISNRLVRLQGRFAKLRYVLSRVFPSAEVLSLTYPGIMNQRWKIPLIWIRRLIRAVLIHPWDTLKELKILNGKHKK